VADLFRIFETKPDHPLADAGEAERLLASLPEKDPRAALEDLHNWLGSLAGFDGFACDDRLARVKLLDDAGRKRAAALFKAFLKHAHQRDRGERQREQTLHAYWENLGAAYGRCAADQEQGVKRAAEIKEELPAILARSFRAAFAAAKVRCLNYLPAVDAAQWAPLYRRLGFAELARLLDASVLAYEREVHTTPRAEAAKLLAFSLAEMHELPPAQVELAARLLDRFAISFSWSRERSAAHPFVIDLAAGAPPRYAQAKEPAAPSKRYFGGGAALAKLAELEKLSAENLLAEEMRFGADFTPAQIVTVIRHLLKHFGPRPPRRRAERQAAAGGFLVVRGFRAICQRVTTIELGDATLGEDLKVQRRQQEEKHGIRIAAEEIEEVPEAWRAVNRSDWGIGAQIPQGAATWAEPGVLCGIADKEGAPWGVAIVRRLDIAPSGAAQCGMQVLSKKPVSVWLRVIGTEGHEVSNWETSTGSFAYQYVRALVLPDAAKVNERPVMLLEKQKFVPDQICEIVMGEKSRHIKLAEFLEEGADYLRAGFSWMS
jgi:hypothetical protein